MTRSGGTGGTGGTMRRTGVLVLAGILGVLLLTPCAAFAAEKRGLTVTPLDDDFGGGNAQNAPPPGTPPSSAGQGAPVPPGTARPSATDGTVMAYLVDLARKQNRPCPSGITPPAPPPLMFSEPLCRVAEAMNGGKEFPAALADQGLAVERWRMFSATEPSAQKVAASLRQTHCEALLEPFTHIGAARDGSGWRIVMAILTDKKPAAPEDAPPPSAAPVPAQPQAVPPGGTAGQ